MSPQKITVLALAGTGFPDSADPITEDFFSHFDAEKFECRTVPYPASFGGTGPSFSVSRHAGRLALINAIISLDGAPCVLAGYSQGAVIAGDLAQEITEDGMTHWNVKACALIADGLRPEGIGLVPPGETMGLSEGYGIAGQRPVSGSLFPTFWVSAWGDPIASLPAGNPLRTLADFVEWYSLSGPDAFAKWGADLLDKVITGRLQDWWAPWKWAGWAGALAFARGYLFDGRHTVDYIIHDYTRTLAKAVQDAMEV